MSGGSLPRLFTHCVGMALPLLYDPAAPAGIQEQNQTVVEIRVLATSLRHRPAAQPGQERGDFPAAAALVAWQRPSI